MYHNSTGNNLLRPDYSNAIWSFSDISSGCEWQYNVVVYIIYMRIGINFVYDRDTHNNKHTIKPFAPKIATFSQIIFRKIENRQKKQDV